MEANWNGADVCYQRVQNILHQMARRGHATPAIFKKGRMVSQGKTSEELDEAVKMLGRFREEEVKAFILECRDKGYDPNLDFRSL